MLGRLALAAGDTATAGRHLAAAVAVFRDGDYLTELADTLPGLADLRPGHRGPGHRRALRWPRRSPSPPPAAWYPPSAAALAARARIRAAQATATARTRTCWPRAGTPPTPRCGWPPATTWPGTNSTPCAPTPHSTRPKALDRGWAAKADALHARLVPPGLDPDPLATVERLVAEQKAAEEANDENEGDD